MLILKKLLSLGYVERSFSSEYVVQILNSINNIEAIQFFLLELNY